MEQRQTKCTNSNTNKMHNQPHSSMLDQPEIIQIIRTKQITHNLPIQSSARRHSTLVVAAGVRAVGFVVCRCAACCDVGRCQVCGAGTVRLYCAPPARRGGEKP